MKSNHRKLFLMVANTMILITLFIMLGQHNLIGELACLVVTGVLLLITQTARRPNTRL